MVSSASHSDYSEKEIAGFNTNDSGAVSDSLYINGNKTIGIYVIAATGAHSNHIITIQISPNDSDWFDSADTVTGLGYKEVDTIAQYIRVKVTTVESATSTCDIFIASK